MSRCSYSRSHCIDPGGGEICHRQLVAASVLVHANCVPSETSAQVESICGIKASKRTHLPSTFEEIICEQASRHRCPKCFPYTRTIHIISILQNHLNIS
ncbi:hypothetical protein PGT21_030591 [Puccinia graminis f. sp. tritici]|uniref:Uncharacterized protein n=1 Tax=Puccinia graminis f. sp. tritici TaxID=56615 RepID=A0A5B0MG81_PUCGR|nr:hypothetical protein PGT21_030591 [Puccinia graminis f. sp. tritici]